MIGLTSPHLCRRKICNPYSTTWPGPPSHKARAWARRPAHKQTVSNRLVLPDFLQGKPTKYTLVGFMRTRGDEFWWTQGLMAAGLGVSRRTVGRWLQQLEREGIVERRRASQGRTRALSLWASSVFPQPARSAPDE